MSNYKDLKHKNLVDTGTIGTKVATGTTAQRGSTVGEWRLNSTTGFFEGKNATGITVLEPTPTIASVDDAEVDSGAGGNQTIVVTGTNFSSGGTISFVGTSAEFSAATTTYNSATQVTAVAPKSSFLNAEEPYKVKFTSTGGVAGTSAVGLINIDNNPAFVIASGTLGTLADHSRASSNVTTVTATDADGDSITFAKTSGTIPTGLTLNSNGTWSGTANAESSNTTYTFEITATANSKTVTRQYTILVQAPILTNYNSVDTSVSGYSIYAFTTSGSNITMVLNENISADILMVAGGGSGGQSAGDNDMAKGGGGAGQVLFKTGHSLTAGSFTLYVGNGGAGEANAGGSTTTNNGQNTTGFSLTANGGGGGGTGDSHVQAQQGGSAGGSGARDSNATTSVTSNKTTPSGWTSYGNNGGTSQNYNASGGGGGGAGANGGNQSGSSNSATSLGGVGGVGVDLSSTFGTALGESGWFAGGGAGGTYRGTPSSAITMAYASGGNGGGGDGVASTDRNSGAWYGFIATSNEAAGFDRDGQANTGGGGGGAAEDANSTANQGSAAGAGGSGVILIRVAS